MIDASRSAAAIPRYTFEHCGLKTLVWFPISYLYSYMCSRRKPWCIFRDLAIFSTLKKHIVQFSPWPNLVASYIPPSTTKRLRPRCSAHWMPEQCTRTIVNVLNVYAVRLNAGDKSIKTSDLRRKHNTRSAEVVSTLHRIIYYYNNVTTIA